VHEQDGEGRGRDAGQARSLAEQACAGDACASLVCAATSVCRNASAVIELRMRRLSPIGAAMAIQIVCAQSISMWSQVAAKKKDRAAASGS
jgi:hypothetical protein